MFRMLFNTFKSSALRRLHCADGTNSRKAFSVAAEKKVVAILTSYGATIRHWNLDGLLVVLCKDLTMALYKDLMMALYECFTMALYKCNVHAAK